VVLVGEMPWSVPRSPFELMMDEIAAAASVREVDHLLAEARPRSGQDPGFREMEQLLDAKRRALAAKRGELEAPP
jgi:hypothetical protein